MEEYVGKIENHNFLQLLVTFVFQPITNIFLHNHNSKLSTYFISLFFTVYVSTPYNTMFQTQHHVYLFLKLIDMIYTSHNKEYPWGSLREWFSVASSNLCRSPTSWSAFKFVSSTRKRGCPDPLPHPSSLEAVGIWQRGIPYSWSHSVAKASSVVRGCTM